MTKNIEKPLATYRIVARNDAYGVEISMEDTNPTMVTSFATEAAADAWIEAHKARVLAPPVRGWRGRR